VSHYKPLPTFSKVNQKGQMIKIYADFLQPLIDTVCYAALMGKAELKLIEEVQPS